MASSSRAKVGWALAAVALLLTTLVTFGFSTRHVELNLGPGDSPFVDGFEQNSDVEDKVGWHWTTYAASINLPFVAEGSSVEATLRYARVFGEEAVVNVRIADVATEEFRARGGEVRTTTLKAVGVRGPLTIGISADSHERRNMGLKMDRIQVELLEGAPLRLTLAAAVRPILVVVLLCSGLLLLGASPLLSGTAALVAALGFAFLAHHDLFAAWRQTESSPLMLVASTAFLLGGQRAMNAWTGVGKCHLTWLTSAALIAMLFRLTLISQPDFYYPDLLTHTRVAEAIRSEGPAFFLHPAEALAAQKAWTKPVLGSVSSLPYAVIFHTPFAILGAAFDLNIDQVEKAMKSASALISVLPILLAAALASRLGLPPLAALALCVIPAYTSRLSFALMPALFGHVFDLLAILGLAVLVDDAEMKRRPMLQAMALLLLGHLAYTSSVVNEGVFVLVLLAVLLTKGRRGFRVARRVFAAEAVASLLAFALYYRFFVGDVFGLAGRIVGMGANPSAAVSVYPIESFWSVLLERSNTFFGWAFLLLAVAGVVMVGARIAAAAIVQAWIVTYLVLILLRAKVPDVFRYGHETLFLTPIVCLLAGSALILMWQRGRVWRLASCLVGLVFSMVCLVEQVRAVADQLANAL
ncbi:MAG: hypothetical protein ABI672_20365 [Vicinamibacteria bacterium]